MVPKRCCPKFWAISHALILGCWEVLKRNSNGTYDLDCKPNVQPDKLRKVRLGGLVFRGNCGNYGGFHEGNPKIVVYNVKSHLNGWFGVPPFMETPLWCNGGFNQTRMVCCTLRVLPIGDINVFSWIYIGIWTNCVFFSFDFNFLRLEWRFKNPPGIFLRWNLLQKMMSPVGNGNHGSVSQCRGVGYPEIEW